MKFWITGKVARVRTIDVNIHKPVFLRGLDLNLNCFIIFSSFKFILARAKCILGIKK